MAGAESPSGSGRQPWILKAVLSIVGLGLTASSLRLDWTMNRIEHERHGREETEADVSAFVADYFGATCPERADMMSFPLDQWMNWRKDQLLQTYTKPGAPTLREPVPSVAGKTQVSGEEPTDTPVEGVHTKTIRDALANGYQPGEAAPIPATGRDAVLGNCLRGRSADTNAVEPEIPTEISGISATADGRAVSVVVSVVEDRLSQDHVVDRTSRYFMELARDGDGRLRLTSLRGLILTGGPDAT